MAERRRERWIFCAGCREVSATETGGVGVIGCPHCGRGVWTGRYAVRPVHDSIGLASHVFLWEHRLSMFRALSSVRRLLGAHGVYWNGALVCLLPAAYFVTRASQQRIARRGTLTRSTAEAVS